MRRKELLETAERKLSAPPNHLMIKRLEDRRKTR